MFVDLFNYLLEKIKCKCEEGCEICKLKGFLVLRFINHNPYQWVKYEGINTKEDVINELRKQCKNLLEKQNQEYFIIDEIEWYRYDNILNCEYVPEFEKERFRQKTKQGIEIKKMFSGIINNLSELYKEKNSEL